MYKGIDCGQVLLSVSPGGLFVIPGGSFESGLQKKALVTLREVVGTS